MNTDNCTTLARIANQEPGFMSNAVVAEVAGYARAQIIADNNEIIRLRSLVHTLRGALAELRQEVRRWETYAESFVAEGEDGDLPLIDLNTLQRVSEALRAR